MFGGLPRGDARCLVCNACNRLALLDSAGVDVLTRYLLEYKPGCLEKSSGARSGVKDVVELAKKRNKLYLYMLGYLSGSNSRLFEVKVLIRAIDAILNKQELPSMRDLSKLVRSYSPKYDPYGYWDTVGGYDPVESVTKMLEEEMRITETSESAKKYQKSPFYDIISVVPETLRRLPAIEVKNVAVTKFKFDKNVWERLSNPHFPVRLYLISRKDSRDPNSGAVIPDTKIDYDDGTLTAFPTPIEVWFNNIQIKARFKGLKNKEGTVNPVDLTDHIKSWRAQNVLKIIHVFNKEPYLAYCALVRPYSPEEVLNNILLKPAIPYTITIEAIKKIFQDNDGDETELVTTSTVISLKCPISYSRITYPIKSKRCDHLQCYDALWFLHSQVQIPNWVCPVCQIPIKLDELYICEFSMRVLTSCADNVEQIELLPDCSWNPIYEMEDVSDSDDEDKRTKNESFPMITKTQEKVEPRPLLHKVGDTPVVSLLSDDDEPMDSSVSNSNNTSSMNFNHDVDVQVAQTAKIITAGKGSTRDLSPNGTIKISSDNELPLPKIVKRNCAQTNSSNDDDDDDDLPLAQVARKRGLPIDRLLNSAESSFKLPAVGNNQIGSKSRLTEERNISSSLAPNILGRKPLRNSADTRNFQQLSRDERQLFVGECNNHTRTLDPKTKSNSPSNSMRQNISTSESRETVVIHKEYMPAINGKNDKMRIGYLDSNPFVSNYNSSLNSTDNDRHINRYQIQNATVGAVTSDAKNPQLPPLPKKVLNSTGLPGNSTKDVNINSQKFAQKTNYGGMVNNPLGSRPVINPFLPRKSSGTVYKGNNQVTNHGNNEKKDSPWLL